MLSIDIPETLDQPTTIANYYLHKITGSDTSYTAPLINDGGDLKTIPDADFETILKQVSDTWQQVKLVIEYHITLTVLETTEVQQ